MFRVTTLFRVLAARVRDVSVAAWAVAASVFTGAVGYAQVAGATAVINAKELTTSLESEVSTNLPYILTLVGVLLAIGLIIGLARRHAKPS